MSFSFSLSYTYVSQNNTRTIILNSLCLKNRWYRHMVILNKCSAKLLTVLVILQGTWIYIQKYYYHYSFCGSPCWELLKIQLKKKRSNSNPFYFLPRLQHSSELLFGKEVLVASTNDMFSGFSSKTNHFLKQCCVCPFPVFNLSAENKKCWDGTKQGFSSVSSRTKWAGVFWHGPLGLDSLVA